MKRSRFTEEQIIGMLKEQEAGLSTAEICRKHGVSQATFYKYKARFGGLEASDARRRRALAHEDAKLKKLLAEQMLDNAILRGISHVADGVQPNGFPEPAWDARPDEPALCRAFPRLRHDLRDRRLIAHRVPAGAEAHYRFKCVPSDNSTSLIGTSQGIG